MYDAVLLTEEIVGLERNNNNGKIDHSPSGINSKDQVDCVCGALWNASNHLEEFDFEFGDVLDTIVDVSSQGSEADFKHQVIVDFEDEFKRARQIVPDKKSEEEKDYFLDFGLGKRGEGFNEYYMDGIII